MGRYQRAHCHCCQGGALTCGCLPTPLTSHVLSEFLHITQKSLATKSPPAVNGGNGSPAPPKHGPACPNQTHRGPASIPHWLKMRLVLGSAARPPHPPACVTSGTGHPERAQGIGARRQAGCTLMRVKITAAVAPLICAGQSKLHKGTRDNRFLGGLPEDPWRATQLGAPSGAGVGGRRHVQ